MFSATSLVDYLYGEDIDCSEEYEYEEYEECEESNELSIEECIEYETSKVLEVEKVLCEICQILVSKDDFSKHEESKKHRGAILDAKIDEIRKNYNELLEHHTIIWNSVFQYQNLIEKVLSFLPEYQLLSMRRVCKSWMVYLSTPSSLIKQYYLHSGIEITSFKNLYGDENHSFLKFRTSNFVLSTKEVIDLFCKRIKEDELSSSIKLKILVSDIENLDLTELFECISSMSVIELVLKISKIRTSNLLEKFCRNLLIAISKNNNIKILKASIPKNNNVNVNILTCLQHSMHLEYLEISSSWFDYIEVPNTNDFLKLQAVKENMKFSFTNASLKEFIIIGNNSMVPNYRFLWLCEGIRLSDNIIEKFKLENYQMQNFMIDTVEEVSLLLQPDSSMIKELDLGSCGLTYINLDYLQSNTNLTSLNLSNCPLGYKYFPQFKLLKENVSLRHLNVSNCGIYGMGSFTAKSFPRGLHTLDLSNNVKSTGSYTLTASVFDNLASILPELKTLKITHSRFQSLYVISRFVMTTKSLETLLIFEESNFGTVHSILPLFDCFRRNSSITTCDFNHMHFLNLDVTDEMKNSLQDILVKKQSNVHSRPLGSRTKAIR